MTSDPQSQNKEETKPSGVGKFWNELKRRKVVRVAAVYAVVGWLVIQVAVSVFPTLAIPSWALSLVVMCVILGFPISLVLAWAFEMTPQGIKSDSEVQTGELNAPAKGQKHNYITMGLVVLVLTFLVVDRYLFKSEPVVTPLDGNTSPASGETVRLTVSLPDYLQLDNGHSLAISPDGQNIVFSAWREADDSLQIFRRSIDQFEITTLTEGRYPFFSPDGRWIGFKADELLQRVALDGGPAQRLAELNTGIRGADWGEDGTIVFGTSTGVSIGLAKISDSDGELSELAPFDDLHHLWYPQVLPETGAILFTFSPPIANAGELQLLFPETGERRSLLANASAGRVLNSGHLVFVRNGALWAAPFDRDRFEIKGNAVQVQKGVEVLPGGAVQYAVSDNGTLVYRPELRDRISEGTLVLIDRQGAVENLPLPSNRYAHPRFSPDGSRIAVAIQKGDLSNIFIYELSSNKLRQLTLSGGQVPLWTPDGSKITFVSEGALWNIASDFSEEPQLLSTGSKVIRIEGPYSWSPDGRILFWLSGSAISHLTRLEEGGVEYGPLLHWSGGGRSRPNAKFSADGDWISFELFQEDTYDVYIQPYPLGTGPTKRITQEGGRTAIWARDGREIFFSNDGRLWAISIETEATPSWEDPMPLFPIPFQLQVDRFDNYDVAPDGQHFVFIQPLEVQSNEQPSQIQVVLNWTEELKRLVPIPE